MERGDREGAVHAVLGNPDLLALILGKLPTPRLKFKATPGKLQGSRDRWAASQVNAAFRSAALSLPWEAERVEHCDVGSTPSQRALLRSRHVQTWHVCLASQEVYSLEEPALNASSAAGVLHYAHGTENLCVYARSADALLRWVHHSRVPPLSGSTTGSPEARVTVLAGLASLSRLTSLVIQCPHLYCAAWLSELSRLKAVKLVGHCGAPLGGLRTLESLHVVGNWKEKSLLQDWASPRLTALTLYERFLDMGSPPSSRSAQGHGGEDPEARGWLSSLQRLELSTCDWGCLSPGSPGLRELVPGLTYLNYEQLEGNTLDKLLRKGLPVGLKCLHLWGHCPLWAALFALKDLVTLEVRQSNIFTVATAADVVAGLTCLPLLKHSRLHLPVRDEAGVREGLAALAAFLSSRGGRLQLNFHVYPKL